MNTQQNLYQGNAKQSLEKRPDQEQPSTEEKPLEHSEKVDLLEKTVQDNEIFQASQEPSTQDEKPVEPKNQEDPESHQETKKSLGEESIKEIKEDETKVEDQKKRESDEVEVRDEGVKETKETEEESKEAREETKKQQPSQRETQKEESDKDVARRLEKEFTQNYWKGPSARKTKLHGLMRNFLQALRRKTIKDFKKLNPEPYTINCDGLELVDLVYLCYAIQQAKLDKMERGEFKTFPERNPKTKKIEYKDPMPIIILFENKEYILNFTFTGKIENQYGNCKFEAPNGLDTILYGSHVTKYMDDSRYIFSLKFLQAVEIARRKVTYWNKEETYVSINVVVACIMYRQLFKRLGEGNAEKKKQLFKKYWCKVEGGDFHVFTGERREENFNKLLVEYKKVFGINSTRELEENIREHAQEVFGPSTEEEVSETSAQKVPELSSGIEEWINGPSTNLHEINNQKEPRFKDYSNEAKGR